jgi:hypothetical protein
MLDLAGACEIPVTRLFQRDPAGLNATGESDLTNYYDMIEEKQETYLRPVLDKLLPVIATSAWGYVPEDLDYKFNPLRKADPKENADLSKSITDSVIAAFNAGLISQQVALKEMRQQSELTGMWSNITDEDIARANAEVDLGMGETGGAMGGMGGMELPGLGSLPLPLAGEGAPAPTSAPTSAPALAPGSLAHLVKDADCCILSDIFPDGLTGASDGGMLLDGGSGSGNFGHKGRPGLVGGSGNRGGEKDLPKKGEPDKLKSESGEHGESGGTGDPSKAAVSGSAADKDHIIPGVKPSVQKVYDYARAAEKRITPVMTDIAESLGVQMAGLAFSVKTGSSVADKLKRKQGTESSEEAIKNMGDLIRYTQVSDAKDMAANVEKTIDELSKKGFTITKVENKYLDPKSDYKGIHIDFISPEGQKFELQFHTAETLAVKEKMHKAYELERDVNSTSEIREAAKAEIKRIAAGMEWPLDVEKISNYQRE